MEKKQNKGEMHSGIVWILSSISLLIYGILMLTNQHVPGVEKLVDYLSSIETTYIYLAAFISIFVEGLYVVGNFFPGATLVVLLSIFSQVNGPVSFILTIFIIFLGWCLAGVVNILVAKIYGVKILHKMDNDEYLVKDRLWTTWFPAFRANYEVAQIAQGGNLYKVLWSSIKVKFIVSIIMLFYTALLPLFIDVKDISDEEGLTTLLIVAAISFIVGFVKIRKYLKQRTTQ